MVTITEQNPLNKLVERYQSRTNVHNVFGLILFTTEHPHLIKVLRDDDYWNALHAKSGPRWPIFSIRPKEGKVVTRFPESHQGMMTFMVPIREWHEPGQNQKILEALEIENTSELPLMMVFAQGPKGEVLRVVFKITGGSAEECYESVSTAVDVVADAVKNVAEENIKNTYEVFNLMESALNQHILFQRIQQGVSFAEWVKSVFSLFSK
jgi:hypothetical protein